MATYKIKGQRFIRKYAEKNLSPNYAASIEAQTIVEKLCEVPFEAVDAEDAVMISHADEMLDRNVEMRDQFDAALFCAEHQNGLHRAHANVAVYRYTLPDEAIGKTLASLSARVTSDPYNSEGARLHVFTNSTGEIPMNCRVLRGESDEGEIIEDGSTVAGVAKRTEKLVGKETFWYPTVETATLTPTGMTLQKYLFVLVALESYATVRGNWLEGCSYIENSVTIETNAAVSSLSETKLNDLSGALVLKIYSEGLEGGTLHIRAVNKNRELVKTFEIKNFKAGKGVFEYSIRPEADCTYEAYIGEGDFAPQFPFGCTNGRSDGVIELTRTSPSYWRFDLKTWKNNVEILYGKYANVYRHLRMIGEDGNEVEHDRIPENHVTSGRFQRVRIFRAAFIGEGASLNDVAMNHLSDLFLYYKDGTYCEKRTEHKLENLPKIVFDDYMDLGSIQKIIHEGILLGENKFDLDWENLAKDVPTGWTYQSALPKLVNGKYQSQGEEITFNYRGIVYSIILDNDPLYISGEKVNEVAFPAFVRMFDATQVKPSELEGNPHELLFSTGGRNSYTACRIELRKANDTLVVDTGIIRMPIFDRSREKYVYPIELASGSYKFRVSVYNAKFKTDSWSDYASFTV